MALQALIYHPKPHYCSLDINGIVFIGTPDRFSGRKAAKGLMENCDFLSLCVMMRHPTVSSHLFLMESSSLKGEEQEILLKRFLENKIFLLIKVIFIFFSSD